ncbi:energy-coupling factor transporter transmembrane component T family protein [Halocalculus aciditolerans]|uniref:Cobalt ABC transporter permease n=1 Tax=Halocalculus aciditolerans TaxID=1383812 RepID=A0A830FFA3_9EURY|nr:CbiQ family ECF transporter T component [Halocalculus aciditolerans]GGL47587.1 cobalt ABC transporter permease [Halocalculus aciditolerans]
MTTLTYRVGASFAHSLDARAKLLAQAGVAVAAYAWPGRTGILALAVLVLVVGVAARLPPAATARAYALPAAFLLFGVATRALTLGAPWVDVNAGLAALEHAFRVAVVLVAGAAYVRTTPVSETQAVLAAVPGKPGRVLSAGVGFVLRFLPVLVADLKRAKEADDARLGSESALHERMARIASTGLRRVDARSERFALALQARCFAWNPTHPERRARPRDYAVVALAVALLASPIATVVR